MPELEFIADMNISPLTVQELRKKGWNIVRVSEIMSVKTKLHYSYNCQKE